MELLTRKLLILGLPTSLIVPPEDIELLHRTCIALLICALNALDRLPWTVSVVLRVDRGAVITLALTVYIGLHVITSPVVLLLDRLCAMLRIRLIVKLSLTFPCCLLQSLLM